MSAGAWGVGAGISAGGFGADGDREVARSVAGGVAVAAAADGEGVD